MCERATMYSPVYVEPVNAVRLSTRDVIRLQIAVKDRPALGVYNPEGLSLWTLAPLSSSCRVSGIFVHCHRFQATAQQAIYR